MKESRFHLQNVIPIGIEWRLSQLQSEDAVGAAGLAVQLSIGYSSFLLSYKWDKTDFSHAEGQSKD